MLDVYVIILLAAIGIACCIKHQVYSPNSENGLTWMFIGITMQILAIAAAADVVVVPAYKYVLSTMPHELSERRSIVAEVLVGIGCFVYAMIVSILPMLLMDAVSNFRKRRTHEIGAETPNNVIYLDKNE